MGDFSGIRTRYDRDGDEVALDRLAMRDGYGRLFGPQYAFTVGHESSDPFVVNLVQVEDGRVVGGISQMSDIDHPFHACAADTYEDAVAEVMGYFAENPGYVLQASGMRMS